jgi:hypothetical protein
MSIITQSYGGCCIHSFWAQTSPTWPRLRFLGPVSKRRNFAALLARTEHEYPPKHPTARHQVDDDAPIDSFLPHPVDATPTSSFPDPSEPIDPILSSSAAPDSPAHRPPSRARFRFAPAREDGGMDVAGVVPDVPGAGVQARRRGA